MTLRIVDKWVDDDWHRTTLKELDVGDTFRMCEPDGTPVGHEWVVTKTPTVQDGIWGVEAKAAE